MWWLLIALGRADAAELLNGADDDHDGLLPVVELDCDGDGAFALTPVRPAPGAALTPAGLGLASCTDSPQVLPLCFGTWLSTTCAADGLWSVAMDDLARLGVVRDGVRIDRDHNPDCAGADCDDQCASRCEGETEVCDGRDTDCAGAASLLAADTDGIPDTMMSGVGGLVAPVEADLDGDGVTTCALGEPVPDTPTVWTPSWCFLDVAGGGDCDDRCSLVYPGAAQACDGFVLDDACAGPEPAGVALDSAGALVAVADDGDHRRTCGYKGSDVDRSGTEALYALVAFDGTGRATPLLAPRPGAPECDAPLAAGLDALGMGDGRFLERCIAADTCRAVAFAGHHSDWPADCAGLEGTWCSVVRVDVRDGLWEAGDRCTALGVPEQGAFRTVWPRERIRAARRLVVDWECYRLYGTFGCDGAAPAGWSTPYPGPVAAGGHFGNPAFFSVDPTYGPELGRFGAFPAFGVLAGCWSDPVAPIDARAPSVGVTGGDCDPTSADVHRDAIEGPADPVALVGTDHVGCATCRDGVDNDCDGLVDRDDAGCAPCVGGLSCGGDAPGEVPPWAPLLVLALGRVRSRRGA